MLGAEGHGHLGREVDHRGEERTGPPLIGTLAGPLTLSGAIVLVAVAAATAILLAPAALTRK
jgi:hypothetical protein